MTDTDLLQKELIGSKYKKKKTGYKTRGFNQRYACISDEAHALCEDNNVRKLLLLRISNELKMYCIFWYCDPSIKTSSSNKIALKYFMDNKIIFKTETTNIYVVNPKFVRRGDIDGILATTAKMMKGLSKVTKELITDKLSVDEFDFGVELQSQIDQQEQQLQLELDYA